MPGEVTSTAVRHLSSRRDAVTLVGILLAFCLAVICRPFFRFTHSYLNYGYVWLMLSMPLVALKPFLCLREWDRRWWGALVLYPLIFVTSVIGLNVARGIRTQQTYISDIAVITQNEVKVRLIRDCNSGYTPCSLGLRQERLIAPGLLLVRTLDVIDGATSGELSVAGADSIRLRTTELDHRLSPESQGHVNRLYQLKPLLYF